MYACKHMLFFKRYVSITPYFKSFFNIPPAYRHGELDNNTIHILHPLHQFEKFFAVWLTQIIVHELLLKVIVYLFLLVFPVCVSHDQHSQPFLENEWENFKRIYKKNYPKKEEIERFGSRLTHLFCRYIWPSFTELIF